ncbi:hypothetical protein OAJ55_03000 [Candidatus Nitrosopelagicus sp.]|nr:hypothetical protein [Candidatus Nitrosopelagicus sp.]
MKSKFIVLTTLLAAAVLLPVSFVTADIYFDVTRVSENADGTGSFTGLNGAAGLEIFTNTSTSSTYAVVTGFLDDTVSLIDISDPANPALVDTIGAQVVGHKTAVSPDILDGPRNIALFGNDSDGTALSCASTARCEVLGIVTNFQTDSVAVLNFTDPEDKVYFLSNYTQVDGAAAKAGSQSGAFYKDHANISYLAGLLNQWSALDGAWDVATWENATNNAEYAIVTGFFDDGVTIFNMTDPAQFLYVSSNLTDTIDGGASNGPGTDRADLELDGPTGVETFFIPQDGTGLPAIPYAIVTAFIDDGIQILDLSDPEHWPLAGQRMGYPDDNTGSAGGIRAAGTFSNATDGDDGFEVLNGAIDVAVWNTTATDHYGIVVAQLDNSFTVLNLSDPTSKLFENQLSNGTGQYGTSWDITGPTAVDVFEVDGTDHYVAAIATNGTTGSAVSLIDLYIPSSPQPLTSVIRDGTTGSDGIPFNLLDDAQSISTFSLKGVHYAAVTSYDDDAITIIQLNGDKPNTGGASKICGFNYDCEAPTVSKSGGSISINNADLDTSTRYNDADTTSSKVGQMVTVKANIYEEDAIYKTNLYFDFTGTSPDWNDANAGIKYTVSNGNIEIIDNNDIFSADVEANQVGDILQVEFKIMFTGAMDTSHIAIQNIDDSTNYQLLYFKDALEVTEQSTGATPTSADDVLDDEVTQVSASVPDWVKNTAGWWADGAISEGEFVKGVEFLIQQQIINTDAQTTSSEGTDASIPDWVKNTAGWWADGAISEGEFVSAIEHLVKTGTIIII